LAAKKKELNKIYWGEGDDFLGKFCISCETLFRFICKVQRALKLSLNLNSHNVINVYFCNLTMKTINQQVYICVYIYSYNIDNTPQQQPQSQTRANFKPISTKKQRQMQKHQYN